MNNESTAQNNGTEWTLTLPREEVDLLNSVPFMFHTRTKRCAFRPTFQKRWKEFLNNWDETAQEMERQEFTTGQLDEKLLSLGRSIYNHAFNRDFIHWLKNPCIARIDMDGATPVQLATLAKCVHAYFYRGKKERA